MNPKTMFKLSYGLFVLTAKTTKLNGCITNTAIQVTSEPNRISFAVNKANFTHDMLMESKEFTISILSEDADFELFKHFGFQSGRDVDKFADLPTAGSPKTVPRSLPEGPTPISPARSGRPWISEPIHSLSRT